MPELSQEAQKLMKDVLSIEGKHLRELAALAVDRTAQDPDDISIDYATGEILGLLSDTARAARKALARRIILKGGEDPGWGH